MAEIVSPVTSCTACFIPSLVIDVASTLLTINVLPFKDVTGRPALPVVVTVAIAVAGFVTALPATNPAAFAAPAT